MQRPPTSTPRPAASSAKIAALPSAKSIEKAKRTASSLPVAADAVEETPTVQPSMARVLGLRVRRIVIDAGHGGHDSGTIGPGGIEEKDIALDVALRLGHLLQQRLGAEVIYTRRTDKFVPLEERTAIANAAHADLFLSIHANSSSDSEVRGVETYFMNFTTSPDAMAVAARENADSNRSVYELSDLVRKIALSDKIDESREFAGDVQQQLYSGLLSGNAGLKNRGVKQAPFVVLIGAQMPSILAEISFLTNPEDAAELSRPGYRERLAEALYGGVAEYVEAMSGVRIAKTIPAETLAAPAE
jgi:N-acetylmuramoyl-L-alanine amidase